MATLLKNNICVSVVDVVSTFDFNLYGELMNFLRGVAPGPGRRTAADVRRDASHALRRAPPHDGQLVSSARHRPSSADKSLRASNRKKGLNDGDACHPGEHGRRRVRRDTELGIDPLKIGVGDRGHGIRHAPFIPHEADGGGNTPIPESRIPWNACRPALACWFGTPPGNWRSVFIANAYTGARTIALHPCSTSHPPRMRRMPMRP